ncbi:uncharacterized protein C17orf113-like [Branchiostoma floridae x Branchiostoma japonicum]
MGKRKRKLINVKGKPKTLMDFFAKGPTAGQASQKQDESNAHGREDDPSAHDTLASTVLSQSSQESSQSTINNELPGDSSATSCSPTATPQKKKKRVQKASSPASASASTSCSPTAPRPPQKKKKRVQKVSSPASASTSTSCSPTAPRPPQKKKKRVQKVSSPAAGAPSDQPHQPSQEPIVNSESGSPADPPPPQNKKKRKFLSSWLAKYEWLEYRDGKMYCSLCIKHKKVSNFTTSGSTTFQNDTLFDHENCGAHKAAKRIDDLTGNIVKAAARVVSQAELSVTAAMKNVYFLAKEEIATTKHKPLLELQKELGCEAVIALRTGGNATYDSNGMAREFQDAITAVLDEDLRRELDDSRAIAVMIDESTDISTSKNLIVFVNLCSGGVVKTKYLKLKEIEGSSNAENIFRALVSTLQEYGVPLAKVCGLGTDGANVMVGRTNGVAALLKRENGEAFSTHCVAHRHSLAVSQAAANFPYLRRVQNTVGSLHSFFARSARKNQALKEVQEALDEPVLKMLELHRVRWLSFGNCVVNIRRSMRALLEMLREEAEEDPQAAGLYNELRDYKFLYTINMLEDVLAVLNMVSKIFQTKGLDFAQVDSTINSVIGSLQDIAAGQHGPSLTTFLASDLQVLYPGVNITNNNDRARGQAENLTVNFVAAVVQNLRDRFPETELISAFKIFDPQKLPETENLLRNQNYGSAQLDTLLRKYGMEDNDMPVNPAQPLKVNAAEARREWGLVRQLMFRLKRQDVTLVAIDSMWEELEQTHGTELFPNILMLATIARLLPMHTADCERGFSVQNRLKTRLRNALSVNRLDILLNIVINAPERQEFDFHRAYRVWAAVKNRRIVV